MPCVLVFGPTRYSPDDPEPAVGELGEDGDVRDGVRLAGHDDEIVQAVIGDVARPRDRRSRRAGRDMQSVLPSPPAPSLSSTVTVSEPQPRPATSRRPSPLSWPSRILMAVARARQSRRPEDDRTRAAGTPARRARPTRGRRPHDRLRSCRRPLPMIGRSEYVAAVAYETGGASVPSVSCAKTHSRKSLAGSK